ncbi:unnamed protein product [Aphis gossypii]|uniref:Bromodomain associated domain-containing protein n=1 Tax=Aphis gossypii TaxID=80765 RepID=A0A9P0NPX5_APHGO|nr:unnamed protein product [Aphis gossypii]
MEYYSTGLTNKSRSNKKSNSGYDTNDEDEDNDDDDDDDDDDCVAVDKGGKQTLPACIRLLAGNICAIDDEPWTVEESDDFREDNSDNPQILSQKTVGNKQNQKSSSAISKTFPCVKETEEQLHLKNNHVEMFINSELGKIFENIFDSDNALNIEQLQVEEKSELSKKLIVDENINNELALNESNNTTRNAIDIAGISCSTSLPVLPGPSYSTDLPGPSHLTDIPGPSYSTKLPGTSYSTELPGTSYSTEIPGTSYSTELPGTSYSTEIPGTSYSTELPGTSYSTELLGPSHSTDTPGPSYSTDLSGPSCSTSLCDPSGSNDSNIKKDNEMENLINKIYNDFFRTIETSKTNTDTNQDCSKFPKLNVNNENDGNFECFQEDPDIVNPEIMYNIDLNEHYKYMDLLVQKIENATTKQAKQTVLNECMQLMPIPQTEPEPQVFTKEERLKFARGICEWEYKIDRDDWDKIMFKRAVIFTAHAGFDESNEESLQVLSDIIIHYIKEIAIIMKKNFDIQIKSSCPDEIDPINNCLQEIGMKGGLRELIQHYNDDIFGRRKAVMNKCKELQKIIDKFVEQAKNSLYDKTDEENLTNKEIISEEISIDEENKTEAEAKSSAEGNTIIQQNVEHLDD